MALVGPFIRCLYSSDTPVFGSMTTFAWLCPWIFISSTTKFCAIGSTIVTFALVVYQYVAHSSSYLFPVQWPRRHCFTSSFSFWCIFPCCCWWWSCLDWTRNFLLSVLRFLICIHPWRWGCMIFHPCNISALLHSQVWGGVSLSLFGTLVPASKILANSLISLSWVSPILKVILDWLFSRLLLDLQQHVWPYLFNCSWEFHKWR